MRRGRGPGETAQQEQGQETKEVNLLVVVYCFYIGYMCRVLCIYIYKMLLMLAALVCVSAWVKAGQAKLDGVCVCK